MTKAIARADGIATRSNATDVCRRLPQPGQQNPPDSQIGIAIGEMDLPQEGHFRKWRDKCFLSYPRIASSMSMVSPIAKPLNRKLRVSNTAPSRTRVDVKS